MGCGGGWEGKEREKPKNKQNMLDNALATVALGVIYTFEGRGIRGDEMLSSSSSPEASVEKKVGAWWGWKGKENKMLG